MFLSIELLLFGSRYIPMNNVEHFMSIFWLVRRNHTLRGMRVLLGLISMLIDIYTRSGDSLMEVL